jgi:hypothetical protein
MDGGCYTCHTHATHTRQLPPTFQPTYTTISHLNQPRRGPKTALTHHRRRMRRPSVMRLPSVRPSCVRPSVMRPSVRPSVTSNFPSPVKFPVTSREISSRQISRRTSILVTAFGSREFSSRLTSRLKSRHNTSYPLVHLKTQARRRYPQTRAAAEHDWTDGNRRL